MTPRPAGVGERTAAFALLFGRLGPADRDYRAARAAELADRGELDGDGLLVLPGPAGPAGVILAQAVPGCGGLVWPPVVAGAPAPQDEDHLVAAALEYLRGRGARLAQCLLRDDDLPLGAALLRNGFTHVTGLTYLAHDLTLTASWLDVDAGVEFAPFDRADRGLFAQTLETTYAGTFDCPEVNGVRTADEAIEGHRSQGHFDPAAWWLVWHEGRPAGVLLLMEQDSGEWEVVYMGVVPAARRRGLGRAMLCHALCHARLAGGARLTLSVDDRNGPAWALYRRLEFERYDHREVLLALIPPPRSPHDTPRPSTTTPAPPAARPPATRSDS